MPVMHVVNIDGHRMIVGDGEIPHPERVRLVGLRHGLVAVLVLRPEAVAE